MKNFSFLPLPDIIYVYRLRTRNLAQEGLS